MWIVAKIKAREFNLFKRNLAKKFGNDLKFYCPKIQYQKYSKNRFMKCQKFILENYIFCHHEKFNIKHSVNGAKFIRGLEYFLRGHDQNQKEIVSFVEYCKSFENEDGYLKACFFKTMLTKKAKFISGPFANMMFEILERQKNKLKILVGNIVTTISDKKNYLYRPV